MNRFCKLNRKTLNAFTLAEVLIVLGIIGIIAQMTIPAIIQSIQDQEIVVQDKKMYSTISQMLQLYLMNNGGDYSGIFPADQDSNYSMSVLIPYLSTVKTCTTSQVCWGSYKIKEATLNTSMLSDGTYETSISSSWDPGNGTRWSKAILKDGSLIAFQNSSYNAGSICTEYWTSRSKDESGNVVSKVNKSETCGWIWFDVNGTKGPNIYGVDAFEIYVYRNRIASTYAPCGNINNVLQTGKVTRPS